ncbi:hypothetical protein JXB02_03650 [Candidatus Woesearchaeota archaeon]|nr:hypothetical protein [Candidatus Woesearchaeota archaeon]
MCGIGGVLTDNQGLSFYLAKRGALILSQRGEQSHGITGINPLVSLDDPAKKRMETVREAGIISESIPAGTYHKKSSIQKLNDMQEERKARWFLMQTKYTTFHHEKAESIREKRRKLLQNTQPIRLAYGDLEIAFVSNGNYNERRLRPIQREISDLLKDPGLRPYLTFTKTAAISDTFKEYSYQAEIDTAVLAEHLLLLIAKGYSVEEAIQRQLSFKGTQASILYVNRPNAVYAFKSAAGVTPLSIASLDSPEGNGIIIGSETVLFRELTTKVSGNGIRPVRHVLPGEIIRMPSERLEDLVSVRAVRPRPSSAFKGSSRLLEEQGLGCEFGEFYFKSTMSKSYDWDVVVDKIRHESMKEFAESYEEQLKGVSVIIPMQHSGDSYAQGLVHFLHVMPYDAIKKPKDFPGESVRLFIQEEGRRRKRRVINEEVIEERGGNAVITDDSIVRFNTILDAYFDLKRAGAKRITMAIGYSPILFGCHDGMDFADRRRLFAVQVLKKVPHAYDPVSGISYGIDEFNRQATLLARSRIRRALREKMGSGDISPQDAARFNPQDFHILYNSLENIKKTYRRLGLGPRCTHCSSGIDPHHLYTIDVLPLRVPSRP